MRTVSMIALWRPIPCVFVAFLGVVWTRWLASRRRSIPTLDRVTQSIPLTQRVRSQLQSVSLLLLLHRLRSHERQIIRRRGWIETGGCWAAADIDVDKNMRDDAHRQVLYLSRVRCSTAAPQEK